jgi:hypothetical protein
VIHQSGYVAFTAHSAVIAKRTKLRDFMKCNPEKVHRSACKLLLAGYLLVLFFSPEDGGRTLPRNVGKLLPKYTSSHSTSEQSSQSNGFVFRPKSKLGSSSVMLPPKQTCM